MAVNSHGEETSRRESHRETFEQHLERMRIFRKCHDSIERNKSPRATDTPHDATKPAAAEFRKLLPTLVTIGYILNLVKEHGTVLLPRNWQN